MTYSPEELISFALRLIGVLARGQTATAAQSADALELLNQMIDVWSIDGQVSILSFARNAFPLTANQQRYTIGTGGNFNITRPSWIEEARIIPDTSLAAAQQSELPCDVFTVQRWAAKVQKSATSAYPSELYYDHAFTPATERGNIDFWPILTGANVSAVLYTPTVLSQFSSLSTDVNFAPGYPEAIRTNLAVVLAPGYGAPLSDDIVRAAARSKALVEGQNITIPELRCDSAIARGGGFDMRSGR